jgi:hypothetical protein
MRAVARLIISAIILNAAFSTGEALPAEPKYKFADIPKNLLSDAKVVIRNSETIYEILDLNKASIKVTYAITILNNNGIDNSVLKEFYDKFITVRKIQAKLYDRDGAVIKNGANVDVKDYAAIAGYSLFEDNRVKILDPKYRTLPFTVEFTYEIVYDGLFYFPAWEVYDDYNVAVEKSSLKVITPGGFKFRYKEYNHAEFCNISDENGKTVYTWTAENLTAVKREPYGTDITEFTPVVYLAPSDFEIAGFRGNLDSWYNFGEWMNTLNRGRSALNPAATEKVRSLVSGLDNNREKVNALYRYMQSKVRYVSVQVGIGGWQPIEAESVDRLSYGDCKALVNYMKALLDIAGIRSFYTLADAGEDKSPLKIDFPSNQFNHAILCVPDGSDTIWLECTSQTIPFGYIGKFTDDRYVLVTGSEGGTVVKTRKYTINDNCQIRKGVVELAANGNAKATFSTDYNGNFYDDINKVLLMDDTDRKKFIQSRISIPGFNLISFSHSEEKKMVPVIHEYINLGLPGYGTVMGNRILLNPNLMTRSLKPPPRIKERKSDINIRRAYNETDTIVIKIPVGYSADQLPEKVVLTAKFGNYVSEISSDVKVIRYIRVFNFNKGRYPVEDFNLFVDFCEKISSYDERKISLVKNP